MHNQRVQRTPAAPMTRNVIWREMKKAFFIVCTVCVVVGCSRQATPVPQVETGLIPEFESKFDRLFLSQEPLRYQDNVQFLSSIQNTKLSPKEIELVSDKLKAFLSAKSDGRPYAQDSQLTGVASPIAFLRLQAVQILADVGTEEDAAFIRGLDPKAEGEHPVFDEECQKAIKELETR